MQLLLTIALLLCTSIKSSLALKQKRVLKKIDYISKENNILMLEIGVLRAFANNFLNIGQINLDADDFKLVKRLTEGKLVPQPFIDFVNSFMGDEDKTEDLTNKVEGFSDYFAKLKDIVFDQELMSVAIKKITEKYDKWDIIKMGFKAALPTIAKIGAHIVVGLVAPGIGNAILLAAEKAYHLGTQAMCIYKLIKIKGKTLLKFTDKNMINVGYYVTKFIITLVKLLSPVKKSKKIAQKNRFLKTKSLSNQNNQRKLRQAKKIYHF